MSALSSKFARWVDEWKLALAGLGLALGFWSFWVAFIATFLIFGTLMGMLASPSSFQFLTHLPDFGKQLSYLGQIFLTIFEPANFSMLLVTFLQSILIGLIVLTWKHKKSATKSAGLVTGLAVLAGGCPTCGTSLLMPIIGAIFTGSSAAVASVFSWGLTLLAILIALLAFKKLGEEAYVIIVAERRKNGRNEAKKPNRKSK